MTLIETLVGTQAAKALGWTLVHSLWEGALIALALAGALCVIRSSRARYAAACLAMLSIIVAFGLTFTRLAPSQSRVQRWQTADLSRTVGMTSGSEQKIAHRQPTDFLPWLAPFWIAGVVVFHLRTLASWIAAQRLRRTGVCYAPDFWQQRLNRLGARVRVSSPVTLLESCLADVPVVIGYMRPVILMPVGLLVGLPAGQVESILLHELAHIRRYDYLINLLQTSVESLLFYHPAAWWISAVIRAERENCCDDLVVATKGDAHEYAVALAALERNRCAMREAALAATGGSLVKRVRRLLYDREVPRAGLAPVFSVGILTITTALVLAASQSKPADRSPRPATAAAPALPSMPASKAPLKLLAQAQEPPAALPVVSPYLKWLNEDVAYIITDEERAAFKRLETDEERKHFIEQFWLRRDPKPGTSENKFQQEHYRRIAYANKRFGAPNLSGWKTDRGRIHIILGPPDEIESHPRGQGASGPFEMWRYYRIEGVGDNIDFGFTDPTSSGEYRLTLNPLLERAAVGSAGLAPHIAGSNSGTFEAVSPGNDGRSLRPSSESQIGQAPVRIRVGAKVQEQNLITKVDPIYPPLAMQARIQGVVRFTAVIGKDGLVSSIQLVNGHPLLVPAARDALRQWVYKPTLLNGDPVEVVTQVDVNFSLVE